MKFHRTLAFATLLILVLPLTANIASSAGKTQGAVQAKSIFGLAWQHFSSEDFQLARNLAVQGEAAAEQTNSTSIPTQMPLPPVTARAPTASNTTNPIIAAAAIAAIIVAILIWRFRREKQSKV